MVLRSCLTSVSCRWSLAVAEPLIQSSAFIDPGSWEISFEGIHRSEQRRIRGGKLGNHLIKEGQRRREVPALYLSIKFLCSHSSSLHLKKHIRHRPSTPTSQKKNKDSHISSYKHTVALHWRNCEEKKKNFYLLN